MLVFLFLVPLFTGNCDIIGTWVETDKSKEGYTNFLTFHSNGRFEQVIDLDSSWDQDTLQFRGDYIISGDTLFINYSNPKDQVRYKLIRCKKQKIVLEFIPKSGATPERKTLRRTDY